MSRILQDGKETSYNTSEAVEISRNSHFLLCRRSFLYKFLINGLCLGIAT